MTPAEQARPLIARADEDIHVLAMLAGDDQTSDAVWGFHAQQAVEKFLKAILTFHGIRFPFTHRLFELADLLDDSKFPLPENFESLLDLTPYAVELRYSLLLTNQSLGLDRKSVLDQIQQLRRYTCEVTGLSHNL